MTFVKICKMISTNNSIGMRMYNRDGNEYDNDEMEMSENSGESMRKMITNMVKRVLVSI